MVSGTPRCLDTAVTPPSSLMMSCAVMAPDYAIRSTDVNTITNVGVDGRYDSVQLSPVFTKTELLAALVAHGVSNAQIGEVLGLPSSRVSEIMRATPGKDTTLKPRELTYDEGVKLAQAFLPELGQQATPLPLPICRLIVLHIARKLHTSVGEEQLAELAEDLRAFSEYAADPKVRGSVEASEGFFRALSIRR